MLSKNETFKPPEPGEEWSNNEFSNVLDYLSEKQLRFNGSIFLEWLAVPYISIWYAKSTEFEDNYIWVMHNIEFTDYIVSPIIKNPRDALIAFSKKWSGNGSETVRVRNNNRARLVNHGEMLLNVANDKDLWKVSDE